MVTSELILGDVSAEAKRVVELIKAKQHFLLSGGAGSGKTYSLVEVLKEVVNEYPSLNIGCITYTNAAVDEIDSRLLHENVHVSTIHDFLWSNIKHFQRELKETLIELMNDPVQVNIKPLSEKVIENEYYSDCDFIQYKEYLKLAQGIISHDEVISVASRMFEKYDKLCSITKDKYPLILVDEYQDTDPLVIKILLSDMEKSAKENVVGFFGDAMQSIYDGSIGNLELYTKVNPPKVIEVPKLQNRRNPTKIIELANQLRTDGLIQTPSRDISAPNIDENGDVLEGDVTFIYSESNDLDRVREYLGWDFSENSQVKELNLTHSLIAEKAKFPNLMRLYDKDKVREFVKNKVRKSLEKGESDFDTSSQTLAQVIERIGAVKPTRGQEYYINKYSNDYTFALSLPYDHISRLYVDKDQLIDDKKNHVGDKSKPSSNRDELITHLFKIENCVRLYQDNKFNQFMKATDYTISSVRDKKKLNDAIQSFKINPDISIGQVIDQAHELGLVIKDDRLIGFSMEKRYLYNLVCDVAYEEFRNVYDYLEGYLPFSTQHKTKGSEFPSVLVVLDNGMWSQYNFKYLFERNGTDSVRNRSEKIFYVCCTRAMKNLAVFFPGPTLETIKTAVKWFGDDNVVDLDTINNGDLF